MYTERRARIHSLFISSIQFLLLMHGLASEIKTRVMDRLNSQMFIRTLFFIQTFVLVAGDICIKDLENIQARTLIVHGLKDPLVPLEHPDFLHHNIKGSR